MEYSSTSKLNPGTKIKDVIEFVKLLGFEYEGIFKLFIKGKVRCFRWFDSNDYRSWSGVWIGIYEEDGIVFVDTQTSIARSYYDLIHQNQTIRSLKKFFGGNFETDEGKGRYLHPKSLPPSPAESGCYLAFQRFGFNLESAKLYFEKRDFKGPKARFKGDSPIIERDPWIISNNLIVPFLVSIFEDYWKSTYIALFRYSENKEKIMKSGRISSERLAEISGGDGSIEQALAETMNFQRISLVCKHFYSLDSRLNFSKILRKPYKRRKVSLYSFFEEVTNSRNRIVHQAKLDNKMTDDFVRRIFHDLNVGIVNCYKHTTKTYGWAYDKWWVERF